MTETARHLVIAATLCLMLTASALHAEGEGEVVADLAVKVGELRGHRSVSLEPEEDVPEGVEPIEGAEGVRYLRRPLGTDGQLLLAARLWPEPSWIRVDKDFDGDLRDEEPMHLAGPATTLSVTVTVQAPLDGEITEIPLRFVHHHNTGSTCLHLTIPVKKEGSVVLAGRLRPVALVDVDADLRFDGAADHLLIDVDGDTELDGTDGSRDRVETGRPFRMGETGWVARIDSEGRASFRPSEGELPPIAVAWPKSSAVSPGNDAGGEKTPLSRLIREFEAGATFGVASVSERSRLLGRIGRVGTEEAFQYLLKVSRIESNVDLLAGAVRAMGYRDYVAHAPLVMNIARKSTLSKVGTAALQALRGMDAPERRELLMDLLRTTSNDSMYFAAARDLGGFADAKSLTMLEDLARNESEPQRRRYAYEGATRYRPDPPPADLVRAAAEAKDPIHRELGLEHAFRLALPGARDLAFAALDSTDEDVLMQVARILGCSCDAEAAAALIGLVDPPAAVAGRTVMLLRAARRETVAEVVVKALSSMHAGVRARSAEVLGGLPYPSAVEALISRLGKEKDPTVLAALLRALGEQKSSRATRAILGAALASRKNPDALAAVLDALAPVGLNRPEIRRFFEKVLKSRNPADRMLALDAAAGSGNAVAAEFLLRAVEDKEWRVRLVAAQGLGKVRVKRAVPVLIERLDDEEMPRVKSAVEESLFRITGKGFYDIAKLWRKWWEEAEETFEVPQEVPKRKLDDHAGASVASFYGVPVNSDRIVFVIDQSGSMSSQAGDMTKLERAVDETLKVVKKLGSGARINVILFETNIHPWKEGLARLGGGAKAQLAKHLRSKKPMGGTNLYDGLEIALLTKDVDTIYLLSDGSPSSGKFVAHQEILREVGKLNRTRKVAIHCVAVGFDSVLMKELAAQNDGEYVRR